VHLVLLFTLVATDFRGIWIPRWSLNDQNKIFIYLDGRFNHIFLQMFALSEAYYPSVYAPCKRSSDVWLKDFLAEAHRRNIKVSAWINAYYSWGFAPLPGDERHPINSHPGWFLNDHTGRSMLDYQTGELQRLGLEGYYLSPAHSGVQAYLIALVHEILVKYEFDGIHLDYIRYPSPYFIDEISLRSKFLRLYYVDPMISLDREDTKRRYGTWGCDDLKQKWHSFAYEDLTEFIRRFSASVKNRYPSVLISAAVKPNSANAATDFGQDWATWLNAGYIDLVCLMSYTKYLKKYFMQTRKAVKEPHRVMFGLGLFILSPETISMQVQLVDEEPFGGIVYFSYDQLKENPAYLDALKNVRY
jgi:uncharacterized lipoprotein YddW (UPF0748 family)